MKKQIAIRAALLFLPFSLMYAQAPVEPKAADMESLLESPAVSWGEAARFILTAAERGTGLTEEAAFAEVENLAKLPKNAAASGAVDLGGVSLIIMKAFNLEGGLYRFFPNSRYAYRELVWLNIVQGRHDPGMKVSGELFLRILGRALDYTGIDRQPRGEL
jgi:hypothetical protein